MTRRLVPGRRGARPAFTTTAPQPATVPFPKGRFLILAFALLLVISMLLWAESRMEEANRLAFERERENAAPPLAEDRAALLNGLFQGTIRDAVDNTDFTETPSYDRLIYHVRAMPQEEFSGQVTRRLDWADSVARPDLWRGEFVRVRGIVAALEPVRLRHAADNVPDVYRGFLAEPDGSERVAFDYVGMPPQVTTERDVIDIEGVYYRTVSYESKVGGQEVMPYLIARDLKLYRRPADPLTHFEGWKLGVVIAASVGLALVALRLGSRRRQRRTQSPPPPAATTFHKTP